MVPHLTTALTGPLLDLVLSPCIPDLGEGAGCGPNRFYAYGVVARLAELAAAIEVGQLWNKETRA